MIKSINLFYNQVIWKEQVVLVVGAASSRDFRCWYLNNKNWKFFVGWVEERNPTKASWISTQPTIFTFFFLIYFFHTI